MSTNTTDDKRKVTTLRFKQMKERGEKIAMLTAYDYSIAQLVDEAGVDAILVGDSAANVMAGYSSTLPITLDQMIYHAASVVRGVKRALVVCDMPFGTVQVSPKEAVANAVRIMKETGAEATEECCFLACSSRLAQPLPYSTQDRRPPISILNQKSVPQPL